MSRHLARWITLAIFSAAGCLQSMASQVTLQMKLLPHLNATVYEFDASVSTVKAALKKAYDEKWQLSEAKKNRMRVWTGEGDAETKRLLTMLLQLGPGSLFFKGDADGLTKGILDKPGNENDAYFYGTDSPVGVSQIYFKDSQPLIYFADFHIHITVVNSQKTRVEIFTYDSSVNTGIPAPWRPVHGRAFIYVNVPPTSVEEYQILLKIGEQLGAKGMPLLVTPGTNAPVRQLSLSSER